MHNLNPLLSHPYSYQQLPLTDPCYVIPDVANHDYEAPANSYANPNHVYDQASLVSPKLKPTAAKARAERYSGQHGTTGCVSHVVIRCGLPEGNGCCVLVQP